MTAGSPVYPSLPYLHSNADSPMKNSKTYKLDNPCRLQRCKSFARDLKNTISFLCRTSKYSISLRCQEQGTQGYRQAIWMKRGGSVGVILFEAGLLVRSAENYLILYTQKMFLDKINPKTLYLALRTNHWSVDSAWQQWVFSSRSIG